MRERLCTVHCVHVKEFRMVKISTEFSATAYLTTRSWFLANKNLALQLKNNFLASGTYRSSANIGDSGEIRRDRNFLAQQFYPTEKHILCCKCTVFSRR